MTDLEQQLLEMLKKLEWAGERDPWQNFHVCPNCFSSHVIGHTKGCKLAALISKAEAKTEE